MPRFLILGDPHGHENTFKIKPEGKIDAIITPGDLGKCDLVRKYHFKYTIKGIDWIEELPDGLTKKDVKNALQEKVVSTEKVLDYLTKIAPVIMVRGNVEPADKQKDLAKHEKRFGFKIKRYADVFKKYKSRLKIIDFKQLTFKGVTFAGVPNYVEPRWIKTFNPKDMKKFRDMKERYDRFEKAKSFLKKLKKVDILLTHQPPYGYVDQVDSVFVPKHWLGKNAGAPEILQYIKKKQPAFAICGHIHEAAGLTRIKNTTVLNAGVNSKQQYLNIK